jgi:hypothetical protein
VCVCVLGIFEIGSHFLPRLALNCNPEFNDLCLLSSKDYRHEPLVPSSFFLNESYRIFSDFTFNTWIFLKHVALA